jgi:glyoxylate reductase
MKVFVSGNLPADVLSILKGEHDVEMHEQGPPIKRERLLDAVRDKNGLLCMVTDRIDRELLSCAPNLKMIANYGVGFDNVDVPAASERRIPVSNTPDVVTEATADLTFALILSTARRVVEGDRRVREGKFDYWVPFHFLGREVSAKTLGIIGLGRIGRAVVRRARGFNMPTIYHNRRRLNPSLEKEIGAKYSDIYSLLRKSDFVSLHVPLTEETRHLIGPEEFEAMKPSAYLINTSRGAVVNEQALVEALMKKQIAGAGLDVYENEPALSPGLRDLKNAILLPHVGSGTWETRTSIGLRAAINLLVGLKGERPMDCVNWDSIS